MKSELDIRIYIQNWLEGLKLGPVLQDRKQLDDVTKLRDVRTYIFFDLPEGVTDQGPWFSGMCTLSIGSRDQYRGKRDAGVLEKAVIKFQQEFERDGHTDTLDDRENGISFIDMECVGVSPVGRDSHEYQFVFDVIAEKR